MTLWKHLRAFTLLEVLVAVAILGLGLTAILSAQFSAVAGVSHARYINMAVGLARCKMTEVEDKLRVDGFQELDQQDSGACCEGDDGNVFTCSWSVEKPTFPPPDFGELNLDAKLDQSPLGKIAETAETGGVMMPGADGKAPDLSSLAAGGVGGVAQLVMSLVYPDLKALFESSTRRITIIVGWHEGSSERDLTLVQWVTQPQPPPPLNPDDLGGEPGAPTPAPTSSGPSTGRAPSPSGKKPGDMR